MRVAITGGIACGKSLVAKYLNEAGVETIDADDIVHELLPDAEERRRLAAEVFADEGKRRALEAKLHPVVKERIDVFLAERGGVAVVPLLFEVKWDAEYDIICCVRSKKEIQISRMAGTRGYTRGEAEARLAAQMPVADKAARSDYVIDNDGTEAELRARVLEFVEWMKTRERESQKTWQKNSTCSPAR